MTKLYIIDDDPGRHAQFASLVHSLKDEGYAAGNGGSDFQGQAMACMTHESLWDLPHQISGDAVFLVDYRLELGVSTDTLNSLRDRLHSKVAALGADDQIARLLKGARTILGESKYESYFLAVVLCAILKSKGIPTIVISSAGYEAGQPLSEAWKMPIAASASDKAWEKWKEEILKLRVRHADVVISEVLRSYFTPVAYMLNAWTHNYCNTEGRIAGAAIWGIKDIEGTANKALHERAPVSWRPLAPSPIPVTLLRAVGERLGLPLQVSGEDPGPFVLPISPGIMVLLSLRELVKEMTSDNESGKLRPDPKSIVFTQRGDVMSIAIKFDESACAGFSMVKRFLARRDWKQHKTHNDEIIHRIPGGGLSEAIFHLGHARLNGIKGDEPWAKMFRNGSEDWVAWPSFGESSITFHWHI